MIFTVEAINDLLECGQVVAVVFAAQWGLLMLGSVAA